MSCNCWTDSDATEVDGRTRVGSGRGWSAVDVLTGVAYGAKPGGYGNSSLESGSGCACAFPFRAAISWSFSYRALSSIANLLSKAATLSSELVALVVITATFVSGDASWKTGVEGSLVSSLICCWEAIGDVGLPPS